MPSRSDDALAALGRELQALAALVRTIPDSDWSKACPGEDWPVSLTAFHIARGWQRQAEFVEEVASGRGPHLFDWGETHALNATVAAAHPSPTRDEVMTLATKSIERMDKAAAAMTDADLDRIAFVFEGHDRSVLWVMGRLAVRHARGHRESITAAIS